MLQFRQVLEVVEADARAHLPEVLIRRGVKLDVALMHWLPMDGHFTRDHSRDRVQQVSPHPDLLVQHTEATIAFHHAFKQASIEAKLLGEWNLRQLGRPRRQLGVSNQDEFTWPQIVEDDAGLQLADLVGAVQNDSIDEFARRLRSFMAFLVGVDHLLQASVGNKLIVDICDDHSRFGQQTLPDHRKHLGLESLELRRLGDELLVGLLDVELHHGDHDFTEFASVDFILHRFKVNVWVLLHQLNLSLVILFAVKLLVLLLTLVEKLLDLV